MNEEQKLRQLARVARREPPPRVDVAEQVMARLRRREAQTTASLRPLAWVAVAGATIAVPLAIAAGFAWQHLSDPLLLAFAESGGGLL
jgi:hypothetical protein